MHRAELGNVTIAYSDTGEGRPLLCLHGGMGVDGYALRVPGILGLAHAGARVLIPDQRGHGESSSSDPSEYTRHVWATDAHRLAQHLGHQRVALLGYSYGGFIALEYALRWPGTLTHLILVATSAGPVAAEAAHLGSDREMRRFFRAVWPRLFAGEDKHWDLLERAKFSVDAYNAAFMRDLPQYDVRDRVASIFVPTLLVVGEHDAYLRDMEWLAASLPHAWLHVIDGAGHFPFVEAPGAFTGIVAKFLNG